MAVDPPANDRRPRVTGTPIDGQTLTADHGTWTGTAPIDFAYQWQRCDAAGANCVDIAGATDATYTLGPADVGRTLRVVVTGDNGGQTSVPLDADGPIAAAPPVTTSRPTDHRHGRRRPHADRADGTWAGTRADRLHVPVAALRRRRHNCADIAGATGADLRR